MFVFIVVCVQDWVPQEKACLVYLEFECAVSFIAVLIPEVFKLTGPKVNACLVQIILVTSILVLPTHASTEWRIRTEPAPLKFF